MSHPLSTRQRTNRHLVPSTPLRPSVPKREPPEPRRPTADDRTTKPTVPLAAAKTRASISSTDDETNGDPDGNFPA